MLVLRAAYWPYRATSAPPSTGAGPVVGPSVEAVRRAILESVCVQVAFSPDDEQLAGA